VTVAPPALGLEIATVLPTSILDACRSATVGARLRFSVEPLATSTGSSSSTSAFSTPSKSQYDRARRLYFGIGLAKDLATSRGLVKKSSESGNGNASYFAYIDSYFADEEAFENAVKHGVPEALYLKARSMMWDGRDGRAEETIFELLTQSASGGLGRSQWALAMCYFRGLGTSKDIEQARFWAKKAKANHTRVHHGHGKSTRHLTEPFPFESAEMWLGQFVFDDDLPSDWVRRKLMAELERNAYVDLINDECEGAISLPRYFQFWEEPSPDQPGFLVYSVLKPVAPTELTMSQLGLRISFVSGGMQQWEEDADFQFERHLDRSAPVPARLCQVTSVDMPRNQKRLR